MAIENTSTYNGANTVNLVDSDTTITAAQFQEMVDVLDNLVTHTHIYYDDHTTACQCNCACQCARGTI